MPNHLSPALPEAPPSARKRWYLGFDGFTRIVLSRPLGFVALLAVVLGAFVLPPTGISISTCGFHTSTGYPCVGCGLTRSVTCFLQGHASWSIAYHPFGPAFAIVFLIMAVMAILPEKWRESAIRRVQPWDRHLGVATIAFFVLLVAYGIFRISLVASGHPDLDWWKSGDAPPGFVVRGS